VLPTDPRISPAAVQAAWSFQALFPMVHHLYYSSPRVQFATKPIAPPKIIQIPTRHGPVRTLVYQPTHADRRRTVDAGLRSPVHIAVHGGAFIVRMPEQEDNVARYLASELGVYVLAPDYLTAPTVRFPVAEQQCYDVYRWAVAHAHERGWDDRRISVGGASAGAKLAVSVVQQSLDHDFRRPVALSTENGTVDIGRPDERRVSPSPTPIVTADLMTLVRTTYFAGTDLTDPRVSPLRETRLDRFPPTLVLTAELDTLTGEMREFADRLAAAGATVTYREFAGVDHGFTHAEPARVAREALAAIAGHLRTAYEGALRARGGE